MAEQLHKPAVGPILNVVHNHKEEPCNAKARLSGKAT